MKLVHIQKQKLNEKNSSAMCQLCFGAKNEEIDKEFLEFWEWYKDYLLARKFNEYIIDIFKEIKNEKEPIKLIEGIRGIIITVEYYRKPEKTLTKIQKRLGRLMTLRAHEDITFE